MYTCSHAISGNKCCQLKRVNIGGVTTKNLKAAILGLMYEGSKVFFNTKQ